MQKLLPDRRSAACQRMVINKDAEVEVTFDPTHGSVGYKGLVVCEDPWVCPACGPRLAMLHQQELACIPAWVKRQPIEVQALPPPPAAVYALPYLPRRARPDRPGEAVDGETVKEAKARKADRHRTAERRRSYGARRRSRRLAEFDAKGLPVGIAPMMGMLTLTHSHTAEDSATPELVADQRMRAAKAWDFFRTSKSFRLLEAVGHVRAIEVTDGRWNGAHLHAHVVLVMKATSRLDLVWQIAAADLRAEWMDALRKVGFTGIPKRAFAVTTGPAVANYLAKWDLSWEASGATTKLGKLESRSLVQLLTDAVDNRDKHAEARLAVILPGLRRAHPLHWSKGFKPFVGADKIAETAAAERRERVRLAGIHVTTWRELMRWNTVKRPEDVRGEVQDAVYRVIRVAGPVEAKVQPAVDEAIFRVFEPPPENDVVVVDDDPVTVHDPGMEYRPRPDGLVVTARASTTAAGPPRRPPPPSLASAMKRAGISRRA